MSPTLSLVATDVFQPRYGRSSSLSAASHGTVRRTSCRHLSLTASPSPPPSERRAPARYAQSSDNLGPRTENIPIRHVHDRTQLNRKKKIDIFERSKSLSPNSGPLAPLPTNIHSQHRLTVPKRGPARVTDVSAESLQTVALTDDSNSISLFDGFSGIAELEASDPLLPTAEPPTRPHPTFDPTPFRRWLSKLRRSGSHRRSRSQSTGVVSAVRTATITVADTSIAASRSWFGARRGHARSSASKSGSTDGELLSVGAVMDEATYSRAIRRRRVLEEIIDSEENYIADLKVLTDVYSTLLGSVCITSSYAKSLVRENLNQLLHIHESVLGELHAAIPYSEYNHAHAKEPPTFHFKGHVRWRSADSVVSVVKENRMARKLRHSVDLARPPKRDVPGLTASPRVAGEVAKVFLRWIPSFLAYEEYGAKYEMMLRDLTLTEGNVTPSESFEKGLEVLSRALNSMNSRGEHGSKGMTSADLLIAPIQRVCKYPLLLENLLRQTPIGDGPEAHADIEKALYRSRDAANETNRATDDTDARRLIEKTWLLQDKLVLPETIYPSVHFRLLGHVLLCGVLHVAYQSRSRIDGQYMLCALFQSYLLIAAPRRSTDIFDVVATVPLLNTTIEDSDNGRGLQCHTSSFSWKVVFENQRRAFELLLSASSPEEEEQWQKMLHAGIGTENMNASHTSTSATEICTFSTMDLKPLGSSHGSGNDGMGRRRSSIQRAATVAGPSPDMNQVILKYTESAEYSAYASSSSSLPLSRSHSVDGAGYIPILAPRRSERMQLESSLSDVWSKELLPYPAMRNDNPFRASANQLMRKLSMASITSTFSRRPSTRASSSRIPKPEPQSRPRTPLEYAKDLGRSRSSAAPSKASSKAPRRGSTTFKAGSSARPLLTPIQPPNPVNFHQNPDKFLPEDFELAARLQKHTTRNRRKLTVRPADERGFPVSEQERRMSLRGLHRSLSSRLPTVKDVRGAAEELRPGTPSSLRRSMVGDGEEDEEAEMEEGGVLEKGRVGKLRKFFG